MFLIPVNNTRWHLRMIRESKHSLASKHLSVVIHYISKTPWNVNPTLTAGGEIARAISVNVFASRTTSRELNPGSWESTGANTMPVKIPKRKEGNIYNKTIRLKKNILYTFLHQYFSA